MARLPKVLILGSGGYAQALGEALAGQSDASILVNRANAMFGPSLTENVNVIENAYVGTLVDEGNFDLILPGAINWHWEPWAKKHSWNSGENSIGIFSPHGQGMRLERERAFSMEKALEHGIPCPGWRQFTTKWAAEQFLKDSPWNGKYVLKNPLCGSGSILQATIYDSAEAVLSGLKEPLISGGKEYPVDHDGIFVQQKIEGMEIGHFAIVSGEHVVPLVTNQEYNHVEENNQGQPTGYPLGGLVEADLSDKYELWKELRRN